MNYQQHYDKLINRAKNRLLEGYVEKHHIIPKCMDGSNKKDNLVELTAREHFVAHLLLAKIHGGKLWHAANMMSNMKRYSSRTYKWIRENHALEMSKSMKGNTNGHGNKGKIHLSRRGVKIGPPSEEQKRKQSEKMKGRKLSEKHKRKISIKSKGRFSSLKGNPWPTARRVAQEKRKEKI